MTTQHAIDVSAGDSSPPTASGSAPSPTPPSGGPAGGTAFGVGLRERLRLIHSPREWSCLVVLTCCLCVGVPALHAWTPLDSVLHVPDYAITLLGKYCCYGIVALAMDLVWGYTGILSLGHGVFFALGGYAIGMHMMRAMAGQGVYRSALPDFMVFLDWKELPWFWRGFDLAPYAALMALALPGALAIVFGFFAFRSRIRGVYFSIITQALTYAFMLWFFRNETGVGGNNGLTDFKTLLGFSLADTSTKVGLYGLSVACLFFVYVGCRWIVTSRLGSVLRAIRDNETKVRFTGYSPLRFKLFAWTLSACICGVAGALYVPQVGIINPGEMHPAASIEMAIWVAVGGRGTLYGAVLGAFIVSGLKSWFTAVAPDFWLYVLGALFVAVTLWFPSGFVSVASRLRWPGRVQALAGGQGR